MRNWIGKAEKYFKLCQTPRSQMIDTAALYMSGKAAIWFDDYILGQDHISWAQFAQDVITRFGTDTSVDVLDQFHKLVQTDSLEAYIDEFASLKSQFYNLNHTFCLIIF